MWQGGLGKSESLDSPLLCGYITPDLLSRAVLWPLVWVGKRMNECHHGQRWGGIRRGSERQLAGFESTLL